MNWKPHKSFLMGGTLALGFTSDSRLLLAVSINGRGLFDVQTGDKVARDPSDQDMAIWYRDTEADGIGPCTGVTIPVFGISSPPTDDVIAMLPPFNVDQHITEFKGACLSGDGHYLAIGYSDIIELYTDTQQSDQRDVEED